MEIKKLHIDDYIKTSIGNGYVKMFNNKENQILFECDNLKGLPNCWISKSMVLEIIKPKNIYVVRFLFEDDEIIHEFNTQKDAEQFLKKKKKPKNIIGWDLTLRDRDTFQVLDDIDYYFTDVEELTTYKNDERNKKNV